MSPAFSVCAGASGSESQAAQGLFLTTAAQTLQILLEMSAQTAVPASQVGFLHSVHAWEITEQLKQG